MIEKLVSIDERLVAALKSLETAAGITFPKDIVAKIFADCEGDQVSEKQYLLHDVPGLLITAFVGEYEPEDMFLRIESSAKNETTYRKRLDEVYWEQ